MSTTKWLQISGNNLHCVIDDGLGIAWRLVCWMRLPLRLTVWDRAEGGRWKCIKCFKRERNENEGHRKTRIFIKS